MSAVGITVIQDENLSVNCTIIDKSIVWYMEALTSLDIIIKRLT